MTTPLLRPTVVIAVASTIAVSLASVAGASTASKVVGLGSLTHGGKTAHVKANVAWPSKLTYKVDVKPAQKVSVYTSIVCSMGAKNGNGDQGYGATYPQTFAFRATAPLVRQVHLPFPHPKYCTVEVYSNLSKGGKQALDLIEG